MSKKTLLLSSIIVIVAILICLVIGCGDDGATTFTGSNGNTGATGATGATGTTGAGFTPVPVPTASGNTATISGTLYVNGSPSGAGYNVRLTPVISGMNSSETYGEQQTTKTDGSGFYSFTVSFAGNYIIEGLTPDNSSLIDSQYCYITLGTNITVNLGILPSPVPTPSGDKVTIIGTVYDSAGKPVGSGYTVTITPLMDGSEVASQESYGEVQSTTTDINSQFTFTLSFAGNYMLEVWTSDRTKLLGSVKFSVPSSSFGSILNISIKITRPILTGVTDGDGDDRDPANNVTTVSFTLTGIDFSDTHGSVRFINQSDSSEISAVITSWANTEISGTVDIGEGKYLICVTAYSLDSSEEIYYRKGLFWQNVGIAGFSAGQAGHVSLSVYNGVPYVAYSDLPVSGKATVMKYEGGSWQYVGSGGFSAGAASYTSLFIYNGVPYVAYGDNSTLPQGKATVMKYEGGSWQYVGSGGFSDGDADFTSLFIYNGVPYIAYEDWSLSASGKATVMKYTGLAPTGWESVGSAGFSAGPAERTSLYVYNGVPYIAYRDWSVSGKATVMKYEGSSWDYVGGSPGFSAGEVNYTSFYMYNGVPYVAYQDRNETDWAATVMKYEGGAWQTVGSAGFSAATAQNTSLYMYNGVPYVAYQDSGNGLRATVMKYEGSSWQTVGSAGFSAGEVTYISLSIYNGVPYVAYQDRNETDRAATVMKGDYLP